MDYLDCGDLVALRSISRETKETVERAVEIHYQSLLARYPTNEEFMRIESTKSQIRACTCAAVASLQRVQASLNSFITGITRPPESLQTVSSLVYRLGHPGGTENPQWEQSKWQLMNMDLFTRSLIEFDGRLLDEVKVVTGRYSESEDNRIVKWLLVYLKEYANGCELSNESFLRSVQALTNIERRFACVSKLMFLQSHPSTLPPSTH